jgi:hypothetical protein
MYLRGIDIGYVFKQVLTGAQRHYYFLEGGIAGALSDAVNSALDLPHTAVEDSQAVGYSQAQVVVTMHAYNGFTDVGHVFTDSIY